MFKKGDLSMSTIVMAVIAVLIMVILVGLVMSNLGDAGDAIKSCKSNNGKCSYDSCSQEEYAGYINTHPSWICYDATGRVDAEQKCCVRG